MEIVYFRLINLCANYVKPFIFSRFVESEQLITFTFKASKSFMCAMSRGEARD